MLRALQELGEYLIEEEGRGGLKESLSLDKLEHEEKLLAIKFTSQDTGYVYDGVALFDLDGLEEDILYLKDWHNTYDETPTSKIHRIDTIEEKENRDGTVRNEAIDWIFEGWYYNVEADSPFVTDVLNEYNEKEAKIRRDVKEKWESVEVKDDCVLTVQYEGDDGEMHFIGDFSFFVDQVKAKVIEGWTEKHDEVSRSVDDRCTLCHESQAVFGFAFPFAFYTVDNRKFAPDFDQGRSWQNLPLCEYCALELRVGRNFVENNSFSFYIGEQVQYYVIPSFPIDGPQDDQLMANILSGSGEDDYSFMEAEGFYEAVDLDYPINLDIVFYSTDQSSQKIERHVENVSPPWMREADQTLLKTYRDIYHEHSLASVDYQMDNPESLKQLDTLIFHSLPRTYGDTSAFLTDALDITERILTGDDIEYDRLLTLFGDELHTRLRTNHNHRGYALRAFLFLTFLSRLGVLARDDFRMKDYEDIKADWDETVPEDVQQFFDDFPTAFDTPAKRAVFLEGVLAQHLIDAQSMIRNSDDAPLRKKLSGLRLTVERVQTLLPDLYQDIDAYNRKSDFNIEYRNLRTATARYFAEADDHGWTLTDEEVRYYFVLGMSLNRVFKEDSDNQTADQELIEDIEAEE